MATLLEQAEVGPELSSADLGRNPWALAGRRLRRKGHDPRVQHRDLGR